MPAAPTTQDPILAAIGRRDWGAVEQLAQQRLSRDAGDAAAWFFAGVAAMEQRLWQQAVARLQRAAALRPQEADYQAQLARALSTVSRLPEAIAAVDRALALKPAKALTLDTLGVVCSRAGEHGRAAQAFAAAVKLAPDVAGYRFNLASSLKFIGNFDAAEAAYESCLSLDGRQWRAHYALSHLRRQTAERHHLPRLQQALRDAGDDVDAQLQIRMALFKECEDLGDHAAAFEHLLRGKQARRATLAYRFETDDAPVFDALESAFAAARAPALPPLQPASGPIFVIGLPRTGTTLVERILSSHPDVISVGESQNFPLAVKRAAATRSPRMLDVDTVAAAVAADAQAIGRDYLQVTAPSAAARFVDKMPLNFLYAGWIRAALPQARIVCLRRHPLDACLSNFRQLFALDYSYYNYAYDLLDTARYYHRFDRLIARWRMVAADSMLELSYEDLVADQETQTRRLLDFCGLSWAPQCLAFERNSAPVSTASAVQVRSPLYASAVARWKSYRPALAPVAEWLRQQGIDVDDPPAISP